MKQVFGLVCYAISIMGFLYAYKLYLEDEKKYPVWLRYLLIFLVYLSAGCFAGALEYILVGNRFR